VISNYLLHHLCSFACMEQTGSQLAIVVKCYVKDFHSNVSIQHKFGSNQTKNLEDLYTFMSLVFITEIGDRLFSVRYELRPTKQLTD